MDFSVFLAVAVLFLTVVLLWRLSSCSNLPPGPIGLPFVGYIPYISHTPHFVLQRLAKKYGNVYSLRLGSAFVVVLNDFDSTKEAFAKDAFMGRPPDSPLHLNKETIETQAFDGLPWKEQRNFSLHMLRDSDLGKSKMEGYIREEIGDLLDHLEKNVDKPFSISNLLALSMSNNIGSLVFGKRFKYDDPERQMMTRVLKETASAARQASWQLFFPWIRKVCKFFCVGDVDKLNKIQRDFRDYVRKEIKEHEETINSNNIRDYIDGYLIEIEKRNNPSFCKPVLEDLVGAFFGAGSETVRLTVEWLLLTAASYQEAQGYIQREIDNVTGRNQLPVWEHHKSMPFTQAFIMELMRWRTITPLNILRYALADDEVSGYFVPKGSQLLSNLWAIHHDPEYWGADAEEFRPERFLSEDGLSIRKWERYIPFSIGQRACPGKSLAKVEIFLYVTSILQRFNLRLPDGKVADFDGELGIGLQPKPQKLIFMKRI